MTNISEQNANTLQISRAAQDTLLKEIPIAIFYQDLDLRYVNVSQAFAKENGCSIVDVLGKTVFDLFPYELAEEFQLNHRHVLASGETLTNTNQCITCSNGEQKYFSTVLAPYYDTDGQIIGLVGVNNDISQFTHASNINHKLLQENRALTQKMFEIQEQERLHLARELHDELGQWLTAIRAESQAVINSVSKESDIYSSVQSISESAKRMHEMIHEMLTKLRPALLDSLGLIDSLRQLTKEWCEHHPHINSELVVEGDFENINEATGITLYRVVQEALNNVCTHSKATKVMVHLSRETGVVPTREVLLLKVKDDGVGFDVNHKTKRLGLLGMRERVIAIGGEFTLHSTQGNGVQVIIKLPYEPKEPKKENPLNRVK